MSVTDLLTNPATVTRNVPTGTKDAYGRPVIAPVSASTFGYSKVETQFADPAVGLDGSSVRIFLPIGTDIEFIATVEIDGHVYEVRGDPHLQWNPRIRTYSHIMLLGRRAK